MPNFIAILEKLHYLNHPYLSGLSAASLFLIGAFVLIKNTKSELYRIFFWMNFCVGFWFSGNVLSMLYFSELETSLFCFKVAYTTVPFICVTYFHFYLLQCKKKKRGLRFLYGICALEVAYLWLSQDIKTGAYVLPNVGVYWKGLPEFSYFLTFGMIKFLIISWATVVLFFNEYKKENSSIKKEQLKYLTIGSVVLAMGAVEWLVNFGIPLHFAWIVIPPFFGTMAYVIVRYKAMEIDTVIHRTILWTTTIFLLILPAVIINIVLDKLISAHNAWIHFFASAIFLLLFVSYYNRLKPKIDHLFRRRKYDYQTILGRIAEMIATTINIEDLTRELLIGVCETMYLRNSALFVLAKDRTKFIPSGRWDYRKTEDLNQPPELEIFTGDKQKNLPDNFKELKIDNPVVEWLIKNQNILEKVQAEANPKYEGIKQEALNWFKENDAELVVPLSFENKINALLCLGKKENLQLYNIKDLELLKKLGQDVGLTVFNALHYEDLIEKEKLEEEIRMGRDIQMALLPKDLPQIPSLGISGLMLPAKGIGGDYYDFIILPKEGGVGIVIGDVSGKGIAAGLVMAMAKTAIYALSQEEASPKQILISINQFLNQFAGGQKGMTLLYLQWKSITRTLTYSSAGHEHILIYRTQNNNIEVIMSGGIMLGVPVEIDGLLEEKEISLDTGDKVLLYTDGVTEAENEKGERFGLKRLTESFSANSRKQTTELIQSIKEEVCAFSGPHPQYDDITLVAMEKKE